MKVDGYDIALFPMEHLRITQGRYSNFSHKGYNAYDLAGKDGGIDLMYAPFDLKVEWVDNGKHKTGAVFSNATPIIMANGRKQQPRTVMMMLWHANTIRHLKVGSIIKQGQEFYSEGTAGMATGNHVHIELSYGTYAGGYPLFKLSNGYWTLKGKELNIEDCFYMNDTTMLNALGYKFKTYTTPKQPPKATKTAVEMAQEVIAGLHGNGHENRRKSLGLSVEDYARVRLEVNNLVNKGSKPKKSIQEMAREVIAGKHGYGHATRQHSLGISNEEYQKVRQEVNKLV